MSSRIPCIPSAMAAVAAIGEESSAEGTSSVSTTCAVERVPVEIWHRILCISISCPLIPREDDDYFQRRDVANFGCAKIYQYVKSEQIRMKLSLVCHSWDTFLDEHSDRLVHLSSVIPGAHWPPVRRWDRVVRIVGPKSLTCTCAEWCPIPDRIKESIYRRRVGVQVASRIMETRIRQEYLLLISARCRVIICPYTWRNDLVDQQRFGSVTMLTEEITETSQLSVVFRPYRKLTHLNIFLSFLENLSFTLNLPYLTHLTISVTYAIVGAGTTTSIGPWILPALRCIVFMEPVPEIGIIYLLEQVGQNVTEFHIPPRSSTIGALKTVTLSQIWSFLPKLSIFGASFTRLLSLSAPAASHGHSITLLVHFGNKQRDEIPEETSIMEFQQRWASSNIAQVRIDLYWSEWINISKVYPQWFRASALKAQLKMFDMLNGMGGGLHDRAGVAFGSLVKSQLCEAVEHCRVDSDYSEFSCMLSAG